MDFETAKRIAKQQLASYLEQYHGIDASSRKNFKCLNPEHTDHNPSMGFDENNNRVKCFACGASYDIFDLIGVDFGISGVGQQMKKAFELFSLQVDKDISRSKPAKVETALNWDGTPETAPPPPVQSKTAQGEPPQSQSERLNIGSYIDNCAERHTDYFKQRGIPEELVKRFKLGFDGNFRRGTGGQTWAAAILPNGNGSGYIARNTDANADKKNRYRKAGAGYLFNPDGISSPKRPLIVVEGEFDALSVLAVGGEAVGLGSTSHKDLFLKELGNVPQQNRPPAVVLALDNDEDGAKCAEYLARELKAMGVKSYQMNLYGKYKDANAALLGEPEAFKAAIEQTASLELLDKAEAEKIKAEYMNTSAAAHIQEFVNGIAEAVNTPHIPTGFSGLDTVLDGGLYEGLYIIGAISSLGKTTFALQIIDQIAAAGYDCLIFSLEMARAELMSKSISRFSLIGTIQSGGDTRNAKTARGITAGERYPRYNSTEKALIKQSIDSYKSIAGNIYIHEGIGNINVWDVREIVKKHIEITGRSPIVLVDYLQILAPADVRATDKQNTDKNVLELKRISRDYKIPVIGISSFNRDNYNAPVSMIAFKESGAIEYSSDVLIGLQLEGAGESGFNVDEAKAENPRRVELKVLKNRSGATGGVVLYQYYPQFNYFKETGVKQKTAADKPDSNGNFKVDTTKAAPKPRTSRKDTKKALAEIREAKKAENGELIKINGD